MLVNRADSQKSAARFVGKNWIEPDPPIENQNHNQLDLILHEMSRQARQPPNFGRRYFAEQKTAEIENAKA
jgi:hypothetical protein